MTLQQQFDKTMELLITQGGSGVYINKLIDTYKTTELVFSGFDKPSPGTTKEHILGVYEIRARIEAELKNNTRVFGYEKLLPALRNTIHEHICISAIISGIGIFLVFSDFEREDLTGMLFTKSTEAWHEQSAHRKMTGSAGEQLRYDYSKHENVFINGILKQ